ncbi:ImmA/IrrE family metallo-endopeptidase [Methylomonas sp. MgM2]
MSEPLYKNAASLLQEMKNQGLSIGVPVNVDSIAQELGISVETDFSLHNDQIVGEITFVDGDPVIRINPFENSYEPRRRFTLAHELGHYCLHSASSKKGFTDSRKTMSRSESFWDAFESEANSFAAQLLMPKVSLISEGNKIISNYKQKNNADRMPVGKFVDEMATKFHVSNKAMEYRLKNLKVIQ